MFADVFLCCACYVIGSMCCTIFSIWGVITLIILGAFVSYRGINMGEIKEDDIPETRGHMFGAAGLYLAFVLGCGARFIFLQRQKKTNPTHPGLQ